MRKYFLITLILISCFRSKAQNLFPVKLDNCNTAMFCLDCGERPASTDKDKLADLVANLNKTLDVKNVNGKLLLQILIDSTGHGCVLSHTDRSKSQLSGVIVDALNRFDGWVPARNGEKLVGRTSVNFAVTIANGQLTAGIERVDMNAFKRSFDRPVDPRITNTGYKYKNKHLSAYNFTNWNSRNSDLPDNFNDNIAIDNNNIVWLTVEEGLVQFDGSHFTRTEQDLTPKGKYFSYQAVAVDNANTKWVFGKDNVYSYNGVKWTIHDQQNPDIKGGYKIIANKNTGELFFCTNKGLYILKDGQWQVINTTNTQELPSDRVYFAGRDSKGRMWIGTFSGSIMIDAGGNKTVFNSTTTVLKGQTITSMDEDELGNVYFSLFEYAPKDPKQVNRNEGIAVYKPGGEIIQYTTDNSGMPTNHTSKLVYDRTEKVLWIATDRAGLVRFDLKDGWENYHNKNSGIPTSYISDMAFDSKGTLYLATRQGLVRVERKP